MIGQQAESAKSPSTMTRVPNRSHFRVRTYFSIMNHHLWTVMAQQDNILLFCPALWHTRLSLSTGSTPLPRSSHAPFRHALCYARKIVSSRTRVLVPVYLDIFASRKDSPPYSSPCCALKAKWLQAFELPTPPPPPPAPFKRCSAPIAPAEDGASRSFAVAVAAAACCFAKAWGTVNDRGGGGGMKGESSPTS